MGPKRGSNRSGVVIALMLGAIGLYVGGSVWDALSDATITANGVPSYDGMTFADMEALWAYIQLQRANRWYPWLKYLKDDIATLFLCWLGLTGGSVQFFWQYLQDNAKLALTKTDAIKIALRGLVGGLIVTLTLLAIPGAFKVSGVTGMAALAFFAGMFSDAAYPAVQNIWNGVFNKKGDDDK
jgi:hypothetical protein